MNALAAFVAAIDGTQFVGLCLIFLAACVYVAAQIAKLGQSEQATCTRPTSSNRKAGRTTAGGRR